MAEQSQPYVGPRPFKREDAPFFFGRGREANELLSLVISHSEVLLYAQSGAGKTSLINAKLLSLLEEGEGLEVLPLASVKGPPSTLPQPEIANIYVFNTLVSWAKGAAVPEALAKMTLREFLEQREQSIDKEGLPKPCVAIFDQFEELFTSYPEHWEQRRGFFEQVRDALAIPRLRTLFAMREDFIAAIDRYARIMPEEFRIRFHLENLRCPQAIEAITYPVRGQNRHFGAGVAEKLATDLMTVQVETASGGTEGVVGEFIEPVQLQVVCQRLWRDLGPDDTEITLEHLKTVTVEKALLRFYEESVTDVARETDIAEAVLRRWFEQKLVTPAGTRGMVFRGKTETEGLPNKAVDALEKLYLIRSELRGKDRWYELMHDRFVDAIQKSHQKWIATRAVAEGMRLRLEEKAAKWQSDGRSEAALLDDVQFREAQRWLLSDEAREVGYDDNVEPFVDASRAAAEHAKREKEIELKNAQLLAAKEKQRAEEQLAAAKRLKRFAFALAVLFVLSAATAALSVWWGIKASKLHAIADQKTTEATANAVKEKEARRQANDSKDEAEKQAKIARAGELSAQAARQIAIDPELSLILATEAVRTWPNAADAVTALRQALAQSRVRFVIPFKAMVVRAGFDRTGTKILAATGNRAEIWDANSRKMIVPTYDGHTDEVDAAVFSPDGQFVATASADKTARVFDSETGECKAVLEHTEGVTAAAFSPDGTRVVTTSGEPTAKVWDWKKKKCLKDLPQKSGCAAGAFSPDGTRILIACWDGTATIYDAVTFKKLAQLPANLSSTEDISEPLLCAAFAPSGNVVVTGDNEGIMRFWNLKPTAKGRLSPELIVSDRAHELGINTLEFSRDGLLLVSASLDQTAKIWNLRNLQCACVLRGHMGGVQSATFNKDATQVLTASEDKTMRIWEVPAISQLLSHNKGRINDAVWNWNGKRVVTAGTDGTARVWAFGNESPSPVLKLIGHDQAVSTAEFSPDGNFIVTASDDGTARLWKAESGKKIATLNHDWMVHTAVFSHNGDVILTASYDKTAQCWDMSGGKIGEPFKHSSWVTSAAFSPNDKRIICTTLDSAVVWDVEAHRRIFELHHPVGRINWARFSSDGKYIVTSGGDKTARVWDSETGGPIAILAGHTSWVTTASFNHDGTLIATSGADDIVKLWDPLSGGLISDIPTHSRSVNSAEFSPNGKLLITASDDGTAQIHDISKYQLGNSVDDLLRLADSRITRKLTADEERIYFGQGIAK